MIGQSSVGLMLAQMMQVIKARDFVCFHTVVSTGYFTFSPNTSKGRVMVAATRCVSLLLNKLDKKE